MDFRILGGLDVRRDGVPVDLGPPKQRAVLAVLLLEPGRLVPSERLVQLLWGDEAPKASASLQAYVSNLRRVLEPGRRPRDPATVLVTQPPGYRLVVDRSAVDALIFEDLVSQGRSELAAGDEVGALITLEAALDLWTGPPLPELADEAFTVEPRERLEGIRAAALETLADARLRLGDAAGAVSTLEPVAAEHPLREHLHALLALALYRCGRQAEALRTVDVVRRSLAEAAGLDPGPELRRLEAELLAQSPSLDWAPSTPSTPSTPPTPTVAQADDVPDEPALPRAPADEPARSMLVGRSSELAQLLGSLEAAEAGRGAAVVVLGEPGIGKTRLVEELVVEARRRGVVTAWARCPEDGIVPPFWPAVQLGAQLIDAGITHHRLVPPPADVDDTEAAAIRFALHRGVAAVFAEAATPVLVVIDDLQWADPDSLRLFGGVAAELRGARALVVATCRPPGDDVEPALLDCLAEIARSPGASSITLNGLSPEAVTEWLGARTDVAVPDEVSEVVHGRTGGNPLFVKELTELLASEGRLGDLTAVQRARAIPAGVQFVVRRRVARLPAATQQVLTTAAVVGHQFDLDVVAAVAEEPLSRVLDALAPALDAGLVHDAEGSFRFSHALVAEALAAEVNAARRSRIHAAAAEALVARSGGLTDATAAQVAHHASEGALAGSASLAIEASLRAGRVARARLADEDATAHLTRAVQLLERHRPAATDERVAAVIELASTALRGDLLPEATQAVLQAIDLASSVGDTDAMVRAATLLDQPFIWPNQAYGQVDQQVTAALERVLAAIPADPTPGRASVLSALTCELAYHRDRGRLDAVSEEAERNARTCGDPAVLARTLATRQYVLWQPDDRAARRAVCEEILQLCAAHDLSSDLELLASFALAELDSEEGRFDEALQQLGSCWVLVERMGGLAHRAQLGFFEASLLIAQGRYDTALARGREALELHRRTRRYDADMIGYALDSAVALDRGGLSELLDFILASGVDPGGYRRMFTENVCFGLLELGRADEARALIDALGPCGMPEPDWTWLYVTTVALQVRVDLGMLADVEVLHRSLRPHAGLWASAGTGPVTGGLTDLALARGAAALGDHARAEAWFDAAVAGHERCASPAWLCRSLLHQARHLLDRGHPAGHAALERAASIAAEHEFPELSRRIAATRGEAAGSALV